MDKNSKKMEMQNQTMNENEITLPLLGISQLGFPVIEAEFQDKMLVFLLDTGSDSNRDQYQNEHDHPGFP